MDNLFSKDTIGASGTSAHPAFTLSTHWSAMLPVIWYAKEDMIRLECCILKEMKNEKTVSGRLMGQRPADNE